ncbi:hypothetical protein VTO42DRAFT_7210 [Malbranchea cinnamomea]
MSSEDGSFSDGLPFSWSLAYLPIFYSSEDLGYPNRQYICIIQRWYDYMKEMSNTRPAFSASIKPSNPTSSRLNHRFSIVGHRRQAVPWEGTGPNAYHRRMGCATEE